MAKHLHALLLVSLFAVSPVEAAAKRITHKTKKQAARNHLNYHGGPIMENIQVTDVLWGPKVNKQVANDMPSYLSGLVRSAWFAWLCEYNTLGQPKPTTNQELALGNFVAQKTITPFNKSKKLTKSDIVAELTRQFNAGKLPLPQVDAAGRPLSLYMIEFPAGISVTIAGGTSCVQFCAEHDSMTYKGKQVMISIHPDFGPGSGCAVGCGSGSMVQNQESAHSHELAESVTDPLGTAWWQTSNGNEIGDICDGQQATLKLANGRTATVQKLWSNSRNACIATDSQLAKAPVITGSKSVLVGKTITLKATGATGPFQWYHNGRLIRGATSATLIIKNAKKTDAGRYFARGRCTGSSNAIIVAVK